MENGFLRLPRNFFSCPAWKISRQCSTFEAYLDLLQRAAWREMQYFYKGRYIPLQPGDLITTSIKLAQRWGWQREDVRNWLHKLAEAKVLSFQIVEGALKISLDAYCNARFTGLKDEFWKTENNPAPAPAGDAPVPEEKQAA